MFMLIVYSLVGEDIFYTIAGNKKPGRTGFKKFKINYPNATLLNSVTFKSAFTLFR